MIISNTKKETSGHFFCEVEDTPKYVAHIFGGAVSKKYRLQNYYGTPKYIAHVIGAVSTKYRHPPRTEIADNRVFRETGGH